MGDFLVDFRPPSRRQMRTSASFLRFFDDMHVTLIEDRKFSLVLTSQDEPRLWGPYRSEDDQVIVALCGRVALDQKEWDEAQRVEGVGGLACKFILKCYREGGMQRVGELSGNFVVLVFDRNARKFFIATDRWGLAPAFQQDASVPTVISSHPDALADAVGESRNWDLTSFAEFILTCRLSYPFTHYQRIRALPLASITTVALSEEGGQTRSSRPYFEFRSDPQPDAKLEDLAEGLASAFRNSVARRTWPVLGRSAVALSGGLDSRTILCAAPRRDELIALCCYDQENDEFRTARAVARQAGVPFVPLRRGFDYYADHAAEGVKISGGMGCIASNHFLGFRRAFKDAGVDNLLTGCYCDYVFKGLALNKRVNRWTTRESLGKFDFSYYASHFQVGSDLARSVRERLEEQFPAECRPYDSEPRVAEVERRRVFPLLYEEDNAARSIPQRTMPWYFPVADNDLMDIHLKMSTRMKLNRSLFTRTVKRVCGDAVSRIPDANTGVRVGASILREACSCHLKRAKRLLGRARPSQATDGSWPNWGFYVNHSDKIRALWLQPNPVAFEFFQGLLGKDRFSTDIRAYPGRDVWLFTQLFTLKLWLDQRA
jgi:asparagine synthetase B (glutamine-hydrolysing)